MVAAKHPSQRQRRNRITSAAVLEAAPANRIDLPEHYHERTLAWWDTIWDSPMAAEWLDADVRSMLRIARLDHIFWTTEDAELAAKVAGSIDRLSRQFGLDPMSRRTLQWEIRRVEGAKAPTPVDTPSRARDPRLRALA